MKKHCKIWRRFQFFIQRSLLSKDNHCHEW